MRIITFDPTNRHRQVLDIDGKETAWDSRVDRAGSRLLEELRKLDLSPEDELRVVVGPGHFTGIRVAALVGNTVAKLLGVQLFARRVGETNWRRVNSLQPFYVAPPTITRAKKL